MKEEVFTNESDDLIHAQDGDRLLVLAPGESIVMSKAIELGLAKKSSRAKKEGGDD